MNYYKRHLGDYAKSLSNLSQGQIGAYDLLLDWHYANERPLPLEADELYIIGRCRSKAERDNVDRVLRYFERTTEGYIQKRALEEMAKYTHRRAVNAETGRMGGRPKGSIPETESLSDSLTDSVPKNNPSQNPIAIKEQEQESPIGDLTAGKPAIPPCPQQDIIGIYHETLPELRQVRVWNSTRQKLLASRWREAKERQALDWWRDFFGYVRKSRWLMGQKPGRDGRPFDCDLEWLIRPQNFAKVVEGKYEDAAA